MKYFLIIIFIITTISCSHHNLKKSDTREVASANDIVKAAVKGFGEAANSAKKLFQSKLESIDFALNRWGLSPLPDAFKKEKNRITNSLSTLVDYHWPKYDPLPKEGEDVLSKALKALPIDYHIHALAIFGKNGSSLKLVLRDRSTSKIIRDTVVKHFGEKDFNQKVIACLSGRNNDPKCEIIDYLYRKDGVDILINATPKSRNSKLAYKLFLSRKTFVPNAESSSVDFYNNILEHIYDLPGKSPEWSNHFDIIKIFKVLRSVHLSSSGSEFKHGLEEGAHYFCLLYTSPSPRDRQKSRMPSSA